MQGQAAGQVPDQPHALYLVPHLVLYAAHLAQRHMLDREVGATPAVSGPALASGTGQSSSNVADTGRSQVTALKRCRSDGGDAVAAEGCRHLADGTC